MKKLFIALGLITSLGLLGTLQNQSYNVARAEDELSNEVVSEEVSSDELSSEILSSEDSISASEEIVESEEEITIYENVSQTAKDVIEVIKEVFNQPIVIAGVSTTLGAIVILVFTKLFSVLGKKKTQELFGKIADLSEQIADSVSKKDYKALESQVSSYKEIITLLVESTKNVKVKDKALALLEQLQPVIDENKEFVEEKVDQTIEQGKKSAKEVVDILNKD